MLATKTFVPTVRRSIVSRPRLIQRMDEALQRKLTLVSAGAGFGKTTMVAEWIACRDQPVAWLSLDDGDNDPAGFIGYIIAALQRIEPELGTSVVAALQSPQPPDTDTVLTSLVNEISAREGEFALVLDDYHLVEAGTVDKAVTFLLEHLPPQMHLIISTREDPALPLAQLRARGELGEVRAADLRFTAAEAAEFLNRVMGLGLGAEDVDALEARTEGWIAGLQLAALSMQGTEDKAGFIESFAGSHRFILDYLLEEVLGRQPERIQAFLLRTSILERLCGDLCEAVAPSPDAPAQGTLEALERANLFIIPLDNERRWYRYHHLFAELLRQRLEKSGIDTAELQRRASQWCEGNGLDTEAFQHAAAGGDIERCERLIDEKGLDLHFRGVAVIRHWLESLPRPVLDARPWLWVRFASALLVGGQTIGVEERLQAAEAAEAAALPSVKAAERTSDLNAQIAAVRATLARTQHREEALLVQSGRALEPPNNLLSTSHQRAKWTMAMAEHFQGERIGAGGAGVEAATSTSENGNVIHRSLEVIGLGQTQESENRLHEAAQSYQCALDLIGGQSPTNAAEAHLGLARIQLAWNDLESAERHVRASMQLTEQYAQVIDKFVTSQVLLARLKLAQGDVAEAARVLGQARESALRNNFVHRMVELGGVQVLLLLQQGEVEAAAELAHSRPFPFSKAHVLIAQGEASAALAVLEPLVPQLESRNWPDEHLKLLVLQAAALQAQGETEKAVEVLSEALAMAEPGGFIRVFLDEERPMAELVREAARRGIRPDYVDTLLRAFEAERRAADGKVAEARAQPLEEALSERELEILRLIAKGLSNQEISARLYLALSTVKGHNRVIFNKLHVQRRTEAVARARELGLI